MSGSGAACSRLPGFRRRLPERAPSSKQPCEAITRRKRSPTSSPRTSPPPGWPATDRRADEKCRLHTIGAVVVALVPRTSRGLPTEVLVGKDEGLPRPSVVNTDNILTVPRQRLVRLMEQFSSAKIDELDRALKIALGLES